MIVAICVDDRNGTLFNNRRQSMDREVRRYLLEKAGVRPLWVSPYTAGQFPQEDRARLSVSSKFLEEALEGDLCFVEEQPLAPVADKLEQVILIHWNRHYPSDRKLDLDLSGWHLVSTEELTGNSHPDITVEVYER